MRVLSAGPGGEGGDVSEVLGMMGLVFDVWIIGREWRKRHGGREKGASP
jgi:hypothetical protein